MTTTWDPAPGLFAPFQGTDAFLVGPHSRLLRNGIIFNDRSQLECFWVDDFTGFDSADISVSATPNTEETGELADPGFHTGRTMTMSGWIQAGSYPTLVNMGRYLLDSLVDLYEMNLLIGVAPGSYFTQPDYTIACRPADKPQVATKIEASDISGLLKRNFTVALRASDPTYKSVEEHHAELVPSIVSTLGRKYSRAYNMLYDKQLDSSGTPVSDGSFGDSTNTVLVRNKGNWNASIRAKLTGPMTNIRLVNVTTNQVMYIKDLAAGKSVLIDTAPLRTAVVNQAGVEDITLVESRSDWISLKGARNGSNGDNLIGIYVQSYGTGAKLDLWWNDTGI